MSDAAAHKLRNDARVSERDVGVESRAQCGDAPIDVLSNKCDLAQPHPHGTPGRSRQGWLGLVAGSLRLAAHAKGVAAAATLARGGSDRTNAQQIRQISRISQRKSNSFFFPFFPMFFPNCNFVENE